MSAWRLSNRADTEVARIADRHYNRQTIGSPQFAPPGRCLVLKTAPCDAFWITSFPFARYVRHAWAGEWVCSAFRNEGSALSSDLIREAVAITRWRFVVPERFGLITFIDAGKVRRKRDPGRCFRRAGFRDAGYTRGGLVALLLELADMPEPLAPHGAQLDAFSVEATA